METARPAQDTLTDQNIEHLKEGNPRDAFDLDAVESLRAQQQARYEEALSLQTEQGANPVVAEYFAHNAVELTIDEYLEDKNLHLNNPQYPAYKDGLMQLSTVSIPVEQWTATFKEDGSGEQGQSGRDKTRALYTQLTGEQYYAKTAANTEDQETLADREKELDQLRSTVATLSAKRQGRLGLKDGLFEQVGTYDDALTAYNEQVIALGKLKNEAVINDETLSTTEKNAKIITYLFEEQEKLRVESLDKIQNTKVTKFIKWMTEGGTVKRVVKGVALGAAAGVVGAGIGAIAGVAGAAAVGAGVAAAATGAVRFARGYARNDAKTGRGIDSLDKEKHEGVAANAISDEMLEENDDAFDVAAKYFNDQFEKDTKKEQSKRRKSTIWGLGGIALGAGVGFAAHAALDAGVFDGLMNRNWPTTDGPSGAKSMPFEMNVSPNVADQYEVPTPPPAEVIDSTPEIFADPNFSIEPGEGGISLFESLGLQESQWYEVKDELLANYPNEFYMDGGDVRITNPGPLSIDAQQFIKTRFGL